MTTPAVAEPTIPPRVQFDTARPRAVDLLVLLALRDLGRSNLPTTDLVYSSAPRMNG
ncbi:hypothetical protein ACFUC2_04885 [[Kitasatospora] papulosa]|uniref:hypothetical protein n=1 Tax=Streptomyces TaxID=1883 RepID=UPI0033184EE8